MKLILFLSLFCTMAMANTKSQSAKSAEMTPTVADHSQEINKAERASLEAQIAGLDSQIGASEGMIANINARIQSYQMLDTPGRDGMVAGAQGELSNYQSTLTSLQSQKQSLMLQLSAVNSR